jgi:hypothetical protein
MEDNPTKDEDSNMTENTSNKNVNDGDAMDIDGGEGIL